MIRKNRKKLIIFDIGSHKLEELSIILSPGKHQVYIFIRWSFFKIIKAILQLLKFKFGILSKIKKYLKIVYFYFIEIRKYNLQIISIEPNINVAYKAVKKLRNKYPVYYLPIAILGHDAKHNIEIKKLNFYEHSISSSIYDRGRPIDDSKSKICVGMRFGTLWDQLINENIISDGDPFILRMNCEGSELGVISECKEKNLKPLCVIGSLGDVLKIHGKEADNEVRSLFNFLGTPYHYFKGEDPETWFDMIENWELYADKYLE